MAQRLEGKVAVITGGSSGIGLAVAELFVAEGAYVFITGRRQSELNEAVHQVQKALPLLVPGGFIVLNASIAGTSGSLALSVYGATKAAVRSFARTWCVDLKERNVRVNAISPGVIPTPGYNTSLGMTREQVDDWVRNAIGGYYRLAPSPSYAG